MDPFDFAWSLLKEDPQQITCPLCSEVGSGTWYIDHYPECAERHIQQNSPNIDFIDNERKINFQTGLDSMGQAGVPTDGLQEMIDEMPDVVPKYSGFQGVTSEQSDALQDAMEAAMVERAKASGQIGYHPDPNVRMENTTWRVGLHFDSEPFLHEMRRDWVADRLRFPMDIYDDREHELFGEYMAEMLEGTAIAEELRDNERTWDDVDWEKLVEDEWDAQVQEFYDDLAGGAYEEDDFPDPTDPEHMERSEDARRSRVSSRINRMIHQRWDRDSDQAFSEAWRDVVRDLHDPEIFAESGIDPNNFDAYMRRYLRDNPEGI